MAAVMGFVRVVVMGTSVAVVAMFVVFHVVSSRHHENPPAQPHDIDLGPVKPRQDRPCNHVIHAAERRLAARQVHDPVQRPQQRVQLVGA